MVEEIEWILKQVDKLEDIRNFAVHTPLVLLGNTPWERQVLDSFFPHQDNVVPDLTMGNRRAMNASERKGLVAEFRWARVAALVLRNYSMSIDRALRDARFPWPERPSLPNRGQKKTPQSRQRRAQTK
jgi:hypothetical protein